MASTKLNKILTITIPTWNRAQLLNELLDILCKEIVEFNLENKVSILIFDNGSIDNTHKISKSYFDKYEFIIYKNNGVNIGARDNVLNCFKYCDSDFLLLIGDDDRIKFGSISNIIHFIESHSDLHLLIDISLPKYFSKNTDRINIAELLRNYLYLVGNAGCFVFNVTLCHRILNIHEYNFFSRSWPQTQLMILSLIEFGNDSVIYVSPLKINSSGLHDEVMIYNSLYLSRTTFFDLLDAFFTISPKLDKELFQIGRAFFTKIVFQVAYNIIQCGVFVDSKTERNRTVNFINNNVTKLNYIEQLTFKIVVILFKFPITISTTIINVALYILGGKKALNKKQHFVNIQTRKKKAADINHLAIREFDFSQHKY